MNIAKLAGLAKRPVGVRARSHCQCLGCAGAAEVARITHAFMGADHHPPRIVDGSLPHRVADRKQPVQPTLRSPMRIEEESRHPRSGRKMLRAHHLKSGTTGA